MGGKELKCLDANMLFGGINKVQYYPIFPLSCACDIYLPPSNEIYNLPKDDINKEDSKPTKDFVKTAGGALPPSRPLYTTNAYIFDKKCSPPVTADLKSEEYLRLLRRVLSGVSFGSQLAFFNMNNDGTRLVNEFNQDTTVNQGYTVSIYGTNSASNHIKCGMTHYQITRDKKIDKKEQEKSSYTTQFDFSIGAKMLSLVVGCLISTADRPRLASNFYQAAYYTDNLNNKFDNVDNINIIGNYNGLFEDSITNLLCKPGIPTVIPPSYMLKNIEKFTYYQNSNIFNYRPIKRW